MCESDSLSQFYPVRECLGSMNLTHTGWRLCLRHRHFSGSWDSCSVDTFENLTTGEMLDVIDAVTQRWETLALTWDGLEVEQPATGRTDEL